MKIGIAGYTGRVGQILSSELTSGEWPNTELAGGILGPHEDTFESAGLHLTKDPADMFKHCDVIIDFSVPEATRANIEAAKQFGKTLVIGTTGLKDDDEKAMLDAAKSCKIIYAANMSLGVNLLLALVEKAAKSLDIDWDIEVFESHHKNKIDAPSGTALALGHAAAIGRGKTSEKDNTNNENKALYSASAMQNATLDRNGKRKEGEIGYAVSRGGDVVGEHTVTFYGAGERIELSHRATNRALFAKGALRAAIWSEKKPNGLYSMKDILGL